jgi:hypothetical protein
MTYSSSEDNSSAADKPTIAGSQYVIALAKPVKSAHTCNNKKLHDFANTFRRPQALQVIYGRLFRVASISQNVLLNIIFNPCQQHQFHAHQEGVCAYFMVVSASGLGYCKGIFLERLLFLANGARRGFVTCSLTDTPSPASILETISSFFSTLIIPLFSFMGTDIMTPILFLFRRCVLSRLYTCVLCHNTKQ